MDDANLDVGQPIVNLLLGESVENTPDGRPNLAFDPFWSAMVRQIGVALEIPFEVLTMRFQSRYRAAHAELLLAWKGFPLDVNRRGQSVTRLVLVPFCRTAPI